MEQFERAIRHNMASAERDMKHDEDRHGFVIGAVRKFWSVYEAHKIDDQQFDRLIEILSGFAGGTYRTFISEMVRDYKDGNPPIIVGY